MVTYPYEDLGPERFQELCQAVILQRFPRAQAMPVGMPDGGRDAVISRRGKDRTVFQVKYRRKTPLAEATLQDQLIWLQEAMLGELAKIKRLAQGGMSHYVIISNAECSSHGEVGTRDKMLSWLSERIPASVEFDVWWRHDIDRSVESNWDLQRSYGLTNSSSVSSADSLLIEMTGALNPSNPRFLAVRKFLRSQYDRDSVIRFREADLTNQPLLPNYLDVGAKLQLGETNIRRPLRHGYSLKLVPSDINNPSHYYDQQFTGASLLLQLSGTQELTRMVIEGAPGQGKSTLVQYACQVQRARLLAKDIRYVPSEYRHSPILLPIRTDLRDLAAWFQGDNPFDDTSDLSGYPRSVEGFLAAMIHAVSGGGSFTVDDLDAIIATTPALLAFDGLDEVADIEARTQIVNQLVDCSGRLQEIGREVRIIVTSRPSAFSAAPRFPEDRFTYVTLQNLNRPLIGEYTKTWMKTHKVEPGEARKLERILTEKLREPHIAELARNAMQLAILLALMYHQQGNLPDQRTSLYENYISRYLIREAGKSPTMREHGSTVVQLHGYLAWVLHCRAEAGHSRGNIAEAELKKLLGQYLHDMGYAKPDLVEELFRGMAERFIALVSRIQGTWEFDVQPLREYFAAYHLYHTARTSRPGQNVSGTLPDRFDAIARSPYWLNVTRFYVGFFHTGELGYLLHYFREIFREGPYRDEIYPRSLANSILADQVFTQTPAMGRDLSRLIASNPIGWYALARGDGSNVLRIPLDGGGGEIIHIAKEAILLGEGGHSSQVATTLRAFGNREDVANWWMENLPERRSSNWFQWMLAGVELEALNSLAVSQVIAIFDGQCDVLDYGFLFNGSATMAGVDSPACGAKMLEYLRAGLYPHRGFASAFKTVFDLMSFLYHDGYYPGYNIGVFADRQFKGILKRAATADHLAVLNSLFAELGRQADKDWSGRYVEWIQIIGDHLGPCWLVERFSLMHFLFTGKRQDIDSSCSLLDSSKSIYKRLSMAEDRRADLGWWEDSMASGMTDDETQLFLSALLCIAEENVISACLPFLSDLVNSWTPERVAAMIDTIVWADVRRSRLNAKAISWNEIDSPALVGAVAVRLRLDQRQRYLIQAVSTSSDERIRQMLIENLLDTCASRVTRTGRWVGTQDALLRFGGTPRRLGGTPRNNQIHGNAWDYAGGRYQESLNDAVALTVLADPKAYPGELVFLADRSMMEATSSSETLVSRIAVQDHWFDQKQPF